MEPANASRTQWAGKELAAMITQFGLDVTRKGVTTAAGPITVISHHCLGRRLQRGFGTNTDEAVYRDVRLLVAHFAHAGIGESHIDQTFVVPAESGSWLGYVRRVTNKGRTYIVYDARTFT